MNTYANGTRDTLILLNLLSSLNLSTGIIIDTFHSHILLTATKLRSIDSDEETLHTALLSVLHILAGDLAISVHIAVEKG